MFECLFSLSGVEFVSVTSLRLAYQDLELQRKRDEEKLRGLEGKKKEQAERLGMGFSNRRSGILIHAVVLKFGLNVHRRGGGCFGVFFCFFWTVDTMVNKPSKNCHQPEYTVFLNHTVNSLWLLMFIV